MKVGDVYAAGIRTFGDDPLGSEQRTVLYAIIPDGTIIAQY
jgi:hypothetical protein